MSAVLSLPLHPRRRAAPATLLRLLGPVSLSRDGRTNAPWSYAKLPALLALLGASGRTPLARDWMAAMLWPDRDAASLRRALYDLRRQLRDGRAGAPLVGSSRQAVWLQAGLVTDLERIESASQGLRDGSSLAFEAATKALALWDGEFAAGLALPGHDDFELWLMQTRAHWQQRGLALALGLAEQQLRAGLVAQALASAQRAVERVPDADAAHAMLWRCQVAAGQQLMAVHDWRQHQAALAQLGLAPSQALQAQAATLGMAAATAAPATARTPGLAALTEALQQALRGGPGSEAVEALLDEAQARLAAAGRGADTAVRVLLLRRALMLRLMHSPWPQPMGKLAELAERLLCEPLSTSDRLDLVQPLATWHGWMGRGMRGEVLLRGLGDVGRDACLAPVARVRHGMTLSLCHSCSTGDPERSIQAARLGLKLAREHQVPGYDGALHMLMANAALNRDRPGDAALAERALAAALVGGPLQRFDLVNHLQLSAQWQLAHGSAARSLAHAEEGVRMAQAVPFPLQGLSCALLTVAARLQLGEPAAHLAGTLDGAIALARRIGSQGYLMNALFLGAACARRCGDAASALVRSAEAQAIAREVGVKRVRKIPRLLLDEALGLH